LSSAGLRTSSTASMSSNKAVVTGFIGLVLGCILASAFLRQCVRCDSREVETVTDTLIIVDTVTERYPVPVKEAVTDTMLVAVRDTVTLRDTVYIVLGMTQRYYRGPGYEAWDSPTARSRLFPISVSVSAGISSDSKQTAPGTMVRGEPQNESCQTSQNETFINSLPSLCSAFSILSTCARLGLETPCI